MTDQERIPILLTREQDETETETLFTRDDIFDVFGQIGIAAYQGLLMRDAIAAQLRALDAGEGE